MTWAYMGYIAKKRFTGVRDAQQSLSNRLFAGMMNSTLSIMIVMNSVVSCASLSWSFIYVQ